MEKRKILIIDDEVDFTKLVKMNLETTNKYEVITENNASDGLTTAKRFKPDLILLDIIMPDMDGGEVCFQIENDEETKDIPIIFLTAVATQRDVKENNIIKGRPFVSKPIHMEQLTATIDDNII